MFHFGCAQVIELEFYLPCLVVGILVQTFEPGLIVVQAITPSE